MAVSAWNIFDKKGQLQKVFTVAAGGDFVPQHTSYMGGGTWIALTSGSKVSIVKVVRHVGSSVLHSYEARSHTHNFGSFHTPEAITYDGKHPWVLVSTGDIPATYKLIQLRSPRSGTILPSYLLPTSGIEFVGLCMDGPGFGGDDLRGRYFYTIGDNDTVHQLSANPNNTATVVATYAVTAGALATFAGLEFDGKDFWTITTRVLFGNPITGVLKHYTADWKQVEEWSIGASRTGLSTDGHRFWSRSD